MISTATPSDVMTACQVLFGPEVDVNREFLTILHPSGAKAAFRRRARETHPDLHPDDPDTQQRQSLLFQELVMAYSRVSGYCARRPVLSPKPSRARYGTPPDVGVGRGARRPDQQGHYFTGALPLRRMKIGRYLYYHRIISYQVLLDSLTWQRRQRPTIGQLAREWGWLEYGDVVQVLTASSSPGRFGERAQAMGLLNGYQVRQLLRSQHVAQRRLGEFFVLNGYMTPRQLATLLDDMQQHNASLC